MGAAEREQGVVAEDGEVGPDERPQQPSGRGDQGMWMWSSSKNARASATVAAGRIAGAPWIIIVPPGVAAEELVVKPTRHRGDVHPAVAARARTSPADQVGHGRVQARSLPNSCELDRRCLSDAAAGAGDQRDGAIRSFAHEIRHGAPRADRPRGTVHQAARRPSPVIGSRLRVLSVIEATPWQSGSGTGLCVEVAAGRTPASTPTRSTSGRTLG